MWACINQAKKPSKWSKSYFMLEGDKKPFPFSHRKQGIKAFPNIIIQNKGKNGIGLNHVERE